MHISDLRHASTGRDRLTTTSPSHKGSPTIPFFESNLESAQPSVTRTIRSVPGEKSPYEKFHQDHFAVFRFAVFHASSGYSRERANIGRDPYWCATRTSRRRRCPRTT